jgi:hypothetical protein
LSRWVASKGIGFFKFSWILSNGSERYNYPLIQSSEYPYNLEPNNCLSQESSLPFIIINIPIIYFPFNLKAPQGDTYNFPKSQNKFKIEVSPFGALKKFEKV